MTDELQTPAPVEDPHQKVDEYGIPIKSAQPKSEVDDYGIPVKKKILNSSSGSMPQGGWDNFIKKPYTISNVNPNAPVEPDNRHDPEQEAQLNASFQATKSNQTLKEKLDDPGSDYYTTIAKQKAQYEKLHPGSWANTVPIIKHAIGRMGAKIVSDVATIDRDLIGKLAPKTEAAKPLYNEDGSLTEYGQKVDQGREHDILGNMVIGFNAYNDITTKEDQENPLPHTLLGNSASGVINLVPDLALAALFPEDEALSGATRLNKVKNAIWNPLTKVGVVQEGLNSYNEAKQKGKEPGDALKEGVTGAGKGFITYGTMGLLGGVAGDVISPKIYKSLTERGIIKDGAITKAGIDVASDVSVFSLYPIASNLVQGKPFDLDEVESNAGVGALFGALKGFKTFKDFSTTDDAKKENMAKMALSDRQTIAMQNFMNATPESIAEAHTLEHSVGDLNAMAIEEAHKGKEETDTDKKNQHAAAASTLAKASDIKGVTQTILQDKGSFVESIQNSELPDDQKEAIIAKINDIHATLDPVEKIKKEYGEKMTELDGVIQQANDRADVANTGSDPVEKVEAGVVSDKLQKERVSLDTELAKHISDEYERQAKVAAQPLPETLINNEQKPNDTAGEEPLPEKPQADETGNSEADGGIPVESNKEVKETGAEPSKSDTENKSPANTDQEVKGEVQGAAEVSKEIDKKFDDLAKVDTSPEKLKEQKKDIVDQMQEVNDLLGGDTGEEALNRVKDAGYAITDKGQVEFQVKDDGVFKIHPDFLVDGDAINQVQKEFPTELEKQKPNDLNKDNKNQRPGKPRTGTDIDVENVIHNIETAKKVGNEKMQQLFEKEYERIEGKPYVYQENVDNNNEKPIEKVKTSGDELDVPALKNSPYRLAYAEVNGKHGVFEINSGKLVSNLYSNKNELMDNFDKNKDKLTPAAIKGKLASASGGVVTLPYTSEFIEHDIKPALQKIGNTFKDGLGALVRTLSPKTGVSIKALDTITKNLNSRNEAMAALDKVVGDIEKMFDKMKDPERIDFIDRIKRGEKQPTKDLQDIADAYKQLDKDLYDEIAKYKGSLPFKEDHFRVLWEKIPGSEPDAKERKWYSGARRPLEGSKGFFKKATLLDMSEGIAKGGVPVSTNPMTLFKLASADAQRFITASKMFDALKEDGFVKYVPTGKTAPDGFVKINDKIANVYFPVKEGLVKAGEWYVEENAGRLVNNHLSNDYIRNNSVGKGLMQIKNLYTAAELGLSGYHASAIALEGVSSDIGLGLRKMINLGLRGDLKSVGSGIMDILKSPFAPKTTFTLGRSAIKFATVKDFENSEFGKKFLQRNPDAAEYVHDFFMGGGLMKQSEDLKASAFKGLKEQAGKDNYIGAALRTIPALNELVMSPLFDHYIPAMKVGMFMKEFPVALQEQAGRIAAGKTTREAIARKTVSFIDDRLGEMNFDNLFWDRTFKTATQLTLRSVTWKLGNLRAMGGAPIEQAMELHNAYKEGRAPLLEPKAAWVLGLATMQVALAAVTQGLMAGKPLQTFKDIIAPQTDDKDDKQRMILPTYVKDVTHLAYKGPVDYVKSSLAGDVSKLSDIWNNEDFQKFNIYDPEGGVADKAKDIGTYLLPKPISVSNLQKSLKSGDSPVKMGMNFFGLAKAPKYLTQPSIENKIFDMYNLYSPARSKGDKEAYDAKQEISSLYKKGKVDEADKLADQAIEKGLLKPNQISALIKGIGKDDDASVYFFGSDRIPNDIKVHLFNQMTESERDKYDPKGKVRILAEQRANFEDKNKNEKPFSILK